MTNTESLPFNAQRFWSDFLNIADNPEQVDARFNEAYRIGESDAAADEGAKLILSGIKTATSSLLWEYEAASKRPPANNEFNIILDGNSVPVCVVETVWLKIQTFDDVDGAFAWDYGEWDRTLGTWRDQCWRYYSNQCKILNRTPEPHMPLVCERFKVVYSASMG